MMRAHLKPLSNDKHSGFTFNQHWETLKKRYHIISNPGKALCGFSPSIHAGASLTSNSPIFTDAINNTGLATVTYFNDTSQQVRKLEICAGFVPDSIY